MKHRSFLFQAGMLLVFAVAAAVTTLSQTESVTYSFSGTTDGASPIGVIMDAKGNLYGTGAIRRKSVQNGFVPCSLERRLGCRNAGFRAGLQVSFALRSGYRLAFLK